MRIIEIITSKAFLNTITSMAERANAIDHWVRPVSEDGRFSIRILMHANQTQELLDKLQSVLKQEKNARIIVLPVEATLPHPPAEESKTDKVSSVTVSREELYTDMEKNAHYNSNFFLLVFLSTIVAAIGLLENNVAVVIGAMVIAPLLGPNLALALGTALGDTQLMSRAISSVSLGLMFAIFLAYILATIWPGDFQSQELLLRTNVGLDSVALALASGAAAVLSITTGLSSVLVGVMVAVAILPPATTLGIMLGAGNLDLAMGAALLLAVNIVCVNLAAKLVFLIKGVRPRTWLEKKKARQSMVLYITIWVLSLLFLLGIIYLRQA